MSNDDDSAGFERCGAKGRTGQPCGLPAGHGTDHPGIGRCKLHGGSTPNHQRSARTELARRECVKLGLRIETHPADALLEEIYRTQANVYFYEALVGELPTHPDPDEFVPPEPGTDGDGYWNRGAPGVYGRTYHVSGIPTGEAKPHVLVVLYNDERKHLAGVTTAALKLGLDAERVRIAQGQAALIAESFRVFAVALGHDPSAPEVREAFGVGLRAIAGGRA